MLSALIAKGQVMKTVSLPRGRHQLHTMPTSTGYEIRTDASYNWDGRHRGQSPFSVIQYTISGSGHLRFENQRHRIHAGETLLLLVPHNHRYWVEDGERWEFFWLSMNGDEALRIQRSILAATGPILRLAPQTIEALARCSLSLINDEGETPGTASAIAYEATMALYDDVFGGSNAASTKPHTVMRPVVDHILANLDKPLSVDQLAAVSGRSRAHFSRLFAEHEGMPPAEFVLQERMRRAAKLLTTNPDIPVKEISAMIGLDDANYFSKVFRRVFGISPTEFRTTGMYASVSSPLRETQGDAVRHLP
jgi:AraC-like DNA-binding protein